MKLLAEVTPGCPHPRGYGWCYNKPDQLIGVFAPIPLNLIIRLAWRTRARVIATAKPDVIWRAYRVGYNQGLLMGASLVREAVRHSAGRDAASER